MSAVEGALSKISAMIGKDNQIISHYVRNRNVVAVVTKRGMSGRGSAPHTCFHVHATL